MPDEAREMQTIRPASHTTALGELFIADQWALVQQEVCAIEVDRSGSLREAGSRTERSRFLSSLRGSLAGCLPTARAVSSHSFVALRLGFSKFLRFRMTHRFRV